MATQFFDQLAGPLSTLLPNGNWYKRNVKYGIQCDTKINRDDTVKMEVRRPSALFTNVLTTFGVFNCQVVDDIYVADGINTKLLNDYGRLDQALVMDQLRLLTPFRVNVCSDISIAVAENQYENHVSVILNLLRWWLIKDGNGKDMKFGPDEVFYDDGHVSMTYSQYLQAEVGGEINPQSERMPQLMHFGENTVIGEGFYMPNLLGFTERHVEILRKYTGSIKCVHPSRLAFSSPQLVDTITVPSNFPINAGNVMPINDETADEIWEVLCKYIYCNRCQSQFDLAYTIVVMSMFSPLPRAVEANAWVSPVNNIMIPKVGSIRGMLPIMTGGQAYTSRPEAEITWANFINNRYRVFVHGIAACEALYGGIFEIVTAGGNMVTALFETMGVTSASVATPWRVMMECAAYRFGKGFETTWDTLCGPNLMSGLISDVPTQRDIEVTGVSDLSGYEVYRVTVAGIERTRIRSRTVKPALFPVLSYGVNDNRYYLNNKKYGASMQYRPDIGALVSNSASDTNKMMCIMRIAGLDCEALDMMSGRSYKNWAANSNGHVMPIFNPYNAGGAYAMPVSKIYKRTKNWLDLVAVETELRLSIEVTVRNYVVLANGKQVGNFNRTYRPVVRMPKPMSQTDVTTFVIKTGSQASPYTYQDFLLAAMRPNEELPVPALVPLATEPLQFSEQQALEAGLQEQIDIEEHEV